MERFQKISVGILAKEGHASVSVFGAVRFLEEFGIPFEFVSTQEGIFEHSLIIVPSPTEEYVPLLKEYQYAGGKLVVCGTSPNKQFFEGMGISVQTRPEDLQAVLKIENPKAINSNVTSDPIRLSGTVLFVRDDAAFRQIASISVNSIGYPGIFIKGNCVFFSFPVFDELMSWQLEGYAGKRKSKKGVAYLLSLYNLLPTSFRMPLRSLARFVQKRISQGSKKYTAWPIDTSLDTLKQIVFDVIAFQSTTSAGLFSFIKKWPAGFDAAVSLTHDIDYSDCLEKGLPLVIETEKKFGMTSTCNFIANSKRYQLNENNFKELVANGFEIASHGLYHDGLFATVSPDERRFRIAESKKRLEGLSKVRIRGFRAPALHRTDDLWAYLEAEGFEYDMSFPDVDHLTPWRYGMGVSSSMPYRPILVDELQAREFNLYEIPVTAPQDVDLFIDRSLSDSDALSVWIEKSRYVFSKGNLAAYIFHPSYFVSKSRIKLYADLLAYFKGCGVWVVNTGQVVDWLESRRHLEVQIKKKRKNYEVSVLNKHKKAIEHIVLSFVSDKDLRFSSGLDFMVSGATAYPTYDVRLPEIAVNGSFTFEVYS